MNKKISLALALVASVLCLGLFTGCVYDVSVVGSNSYLYNVKGTYLGLDVDGKTTVTVTKGKNYTEYSCAYFDVYRSNGNLIDASTGDKVTSCFSTTKLDSKEFTYNTSKGYIYGYSINLTFEKR